MPQCTCRRHQLGDLFIDTLVCQSTTSAMYLVITRAWLIVQNSLIRDWTKDTTYSLFTMLEVWLQGNSLPWIISAPKPTYPMFWVSIGAIMQYIIYSSQYFTILATQGVYSMTTHQNVWIMWFTEPTRRNETTISYNKRESDRNRIYLFTYFIHSEEPSMSTQEDVSLHITK